MIGNDGVSRAALADALTSTGLPVTALSPAEAPAWLAQSRPSVWVTDLDGSERDAALLAEVGRHPALAGAPLIVAAPAEGEPWRALGRALDVEPEAVVTKPIHVGELAACVRAGLRRREYEAQLRERERHQASVLAITQKLASTQDARDILFLVVQRVADIALVDRCSIVLFGESNNVGYVLATSDDPRLRDLPIDLANYPEIREVSTSGRTLVIPNAAEHPLLEGVRRAPPARGFSSLAIVPIAHDQGTVGVLFLRARASRSFGEHELSSIGTIANATAIALRNARMLRSLRDQTEQNRHARVEAERRVQLFQRYADFFESATDGMVVIDRSGRVLFANPRAREITGFSESELLGMRLPRLFAPAERQRAERLLHGFQDGVYPRGVDFALERRAGEVIVVNVSFSSVLHEDDAVLFSFRDVTRERKTAIELERTKEFLECVIDSSVDGIVSANLRGTVLLFNRAAARIFGYAPEDVVGRMRVDRLYPTGVAREVMRKIRDPAICGYGRLEDYRVDMLAADGTTIQVLLSASLVLDKGKPIGSVGIFTDIRDKLRIQSELEKAQDELRAREKQALVAELAGAAAHELNQPLTSVMGYAELLRRQLAGSPQHLAALQIITDEADRMAEIVRKIGRITKYETKSYVGAAKILDLEKASEESAQGTRG